MDAKLKECPFCGTPPRYLAGKSGYYTERVICDTCDFWMAPAAWGKRPAIAPPVAAGSVDTDKFDTLLRRYASGVVKSRDGDQSEISGAKAGLLEFYNLWGAQQREAGKQEALDLTFSVGKLRERAEKAEARVKELEEEVRLFNQNPANWI